MTGRFLGKSARKGLWVDSFAVEVSRDSGGTSPPFRPFLSRRKNVGMGVVEYSSLTEGLRRNAESFVMRLILDARPIGYGRAGSYRGATSQDGGGDR